MDEQTQEITHFAAYLVRMGNAAGVYTTITQTENAERAVSAVRHHMTTRQNTWREEVKRRMVAPQELAFACWNLATVEPVKVVALSSWMGAFGDELPIFAPTALAAWSLDKHKPVSGRVSIHEVHVAPLVMRCPVCLSEYSADWPDYSFHEYRAGADHVFTCDCDERAPVMQFIAPNREVVDDTGALRFMLNWYKENSL